MRKGYGVEKKGYMDYVWGDDNSGFSSQRIHFGPKAEIMRESGIQA
jgi:hypothetical protein